MSVRHARTAIRRMLSIRGRRGWVGRLWAWIGLTVAFGFVAGAFPLFGVLGFELATASAVFAAILGLDLGGALAREMQRMPAPGIERAAYPGRSLAGSTLVAALVPASIMVIPAGLAALRGIWVPTCDWWFGVESYLAMPVATALLGGALGHALGVVVGPRRFLGAAVALLPVFGVAGAALYRFYAAPAVFTYNAILGYFPGNLYDENVQLGSPLVWSRLEQLAWVVAVVALCATRLDVPRYRLTRAPRPGSRRIGALAIAVVVAAGAVVLHTQSGRLGYRIDAEDIEDALEGRLETEHFIIHYAKTDEIEADIALIAADHEFRYAQVVAQLGAAPAGKIRSFLFADRDQKARWMGARDVEMAKPWRQEIYLDHRAYPHPSLRHEIAHAVASAFGDPIFGVATRRVLGVPVLVSPGLIEGLAVAIDWPGGSDRLTPHEAVRAMQVMGKAPSIRDLLSLRFFSVSSAQSYTTAGSFLRFLLDTYGAARLRALYSSGGDFADAYGKSLAQLEREWLAMIATIELPASVVDASRERFRGTSVFARPCPHAIAKRRERAFDALAEGDRPRAIDLMRHVCGDAPEEPRHRLELGDMLSGGDDLERSEAAMLWTGIARDAQRVTSTLRAEAFERLAQIAATSGDWDTVRALIGEAVKLPLESNQRRQVDAEALALAHTGPAGEALRGYFWPGASRIDPPTWALLATLAEPELGFTHYLLGLQHRAQKHWAQAAESLDRALALGLPSPPFLRNAARQLAVAGYRTHDRPRLDHAIAALSAPELPTVDHLLAKDWAERLALDAKLHP